jgi:probable HAF family extracellular repeat protein
MCRAKNWLKVVFASLGSACLAASAAPIYTVTNLGSAGSLGSIPTGLNNLGQAVGLTITSGPTMDSFLSVGGVMTNIGPAVGSDRVSSGAFDINDAGQVVMVRDWTNFGPSLPGSAVRSYVYSNGVVAEIVGLGADGTRASAINNQGQVVGRGTLADGRPNAFLFSNGTTSAIDPNGSEYSDAFGISDAGHVVGERIVVGTTLITPFLHFNGVTTDLGSLGGDWGTALAVNNSGQVVGYSLQTNGAYNGFLYENGVMSALGTLGGTTSFAMDINNVGQIVGLSTIADGTTHAFLYENGLMIDLTELVGLQFANQEIDINDLGQITYAGYDSQGNQQAYLLTPVGQLPLPATHGLVAALLIFLAITARSNARRSLTPHQ